MQTELILTQDEKYILLNLIEGEFNTIKNLNANIFFKLKEYETDLYRIHKKICDNLEDEDEE